ncbi:MAG: hypothetical protein ACX94D_08310 [Henriciella sp.]
MTTEDTDKKPKSTPHVFNWGCICILLGGLVFGVLQGTIYDIRTSAYVDPVTLWDHYVYSGYALVAVVAGFFMVLTGLIVKAIQEAS